MSIYIDIEKKPGNFTLKVNTAAGDEVLAFLGASGCGKSMTLKCIAGIETPDRGKIILDGETLFDSEKKINLSPQKRRTGLMFQNYTLFPNMTVFQNIKAGTLRDKGLSERDEKVKEIIGKFGLTGLENHLPYQLSGGRQQRTALARILISDPKILLLDEPFSALDSHLRLQLEREVMNVIHDFGHSVILVSHNPEEVYRTSDRIAIIDSGRVEDCDDKETIFRHPKTCTAARLTEVANIFACEADGRQLINIPELNIKLSCSADMTGAKHAGIRPSDITPGSGENCFKAEITDVIENTSSTTLYLKPARGSGNRVRILSSPPEAPDFLPGI